MARFQWQIDASSPLSSTLGKLDICALYTKILRVGCRTDAVGDPGCDDGGSEIAAKMSVFIGVFVR